MTIAPTDLPTPDRVPLAGVRRLAGNVVALLTSDIVNRATTFAVYALIARHLSAFAFGQMSLALTFFYTFQVIAVAGLKTLLTREIARDRSQTMAFFTVGSVIVLIASLCALLALAVCVWAMRYSVDTGIIILLLGIGLLPFSLAAVCEAIFLAWERTRYVLYANGPGNLLKLIATWVLLTQGYGVEAVVLIVVATLVVVVVTEWMILAWLITPVRWQFSRSLLLHVARSTSTFLGIDSILAIIPSLNIILLSKFAGEHDVGLYSAASQLLVPVSLIYQSVALGIFPIMCRQIDPGRQNLRLITRTMNELVLGITIPAIIALFFLARPALEFLYGGRGFGDARVGLQIMSWSLISIALTSVLGQVLLADMREKITLRIVGVDALVGVISGVVLIGTWGMPGAALTFLIVRTVDLVQHYFYVTRMLNGVALARSAWKSVVAGACMALYLAVVANQGLWIAGLSASGIYFLVLAVLMGWSKSGRQQLRMLRPLFTR